MKTLGKCPYCNGGKIEVRKTKINGKNVKIYRCSNRHWERDEDIWVLTDNSTCSYRIFSNSLKKYNKRSIGEGEIMTLLKEGEVPVVLHRRRPYWEKDDEGNSKKKHKEYKKYIVCHEEYGIEVLWDIDIEEEEK